MTVVAMSTWSPCWLRRPGESEVRRFLDARRGVPFSCADVGASTTRPPAGWFVNRRRILLGAGDETFAAAVRAIRAWAMFRTGWTEIVPTEPALEAVSLVGVLVRSGGLWFLNPCRVVRTIDEHGLDRRFGVVYGTLPGHVARGEERFLVERRPDDRVWYDLLSFSQPAHWTARLGRPIMRRAQRRFARDSCLAMRRAVGEGADSKKPES